MNLMVTNPAQPEHSKSLVPDTPLAFAGAVLSGGASRRMGRPKSQLAVAGEALLARQLRLLHEAGAVELLVSQHPDRPEPPPVNFPVSLVLDDVRTAGPLAGLERLLAVATPGLVLVVAVDLPRLEVDFLKRLVRHAHPDVGVIPRVDGQLEPLVAVYPRAAHAVAMTHLSRGHYALQDLAQVGLADGWLQPWDLDPFDQVFLTNWNRPEDFSESA